MFRSQVGVFAMNYFISDTHFGHENIIRFCDRPFESVEQMNEAMINNWNDRVTDNDHVYILGDFAFRCVTSVEKILQSLSGKKHLIIGNHDKKWMSTLDLDTYFESVDHAAYIIDDNKQRIWMAHYPVICPPRFTWALYGHIHNNKPAECWDALKNVDRALNCGADVNHFTPATLDELIANNNAWKTQD
jgi:calcineurin-like phosphoesterase family protein